MELTKQEAIQKHRKMWNWIAEETEKRQEKVREEEYFSENGIENIPYKDSYCCEYGVDQLQIGEYEPKCKYCPIKWGRDVDSCIYLWDEKENKVANGLYLRWYHSIDWQEAARLAREIANMPERD